MRLRHKRKAAGDCRLPSHIAICSVPSWSRCPIATKSFWKAPRSVILRAGTYTCVYCDNVTVHGVTIFNPYYAKNGDGIDIDSCRDVSVSDSTIDAGDDVICLKSGRDAAGRKAGRPTENVTITRCTLGHGHGGIVIGSEMSGGVRNVNVSHCTLNGTDDGLRFKTARGRGGVVQNINISDIQMSGIKNACINFDMYYMQKKPATRKSTARPGADENEVEPDPSVAKPLEVMQEPPQPVGRAPRSSAASPSATSPARTRTSAFNYAACPKCPWKM